VPYRAQIAESGLADEVAFYRRLSGHPNPVTPDEYRGWRPGPVWLGDELRTLAARGERVLVFDAERWPLADGPPATVVTDGVVIGLAGYVAGPTVHIADTVGLTDPIASRLRLDERGRTGHEKWRLRDWLVARFVRSDAVEAAAARYPQTRAGRAVLRCGDIPALLDGVTAPMTMERIVWNVVNAPRLTALRIPAQPVSAEAELCRRETEHMTNLPPAPARRAQSGRNSSGSGG
jgi:arabinofuranosyltransferase